MYTRLWNSGRLMTRSKSFSEDVQPSKARVAGYSTYQSFENLLRSNSRRMKLLHANRSNDLDIMRSFLVEQGIDWGRFQADPRRSRNETLAAVKDFCVWFREQFPYYRDDCAVCANKVGVIYYRIV